MYFSTSINKHCGLPVIYLGNCECQFVSEVKYLGVMIHSSMKTTIDVTRQTKKFYMQANLLLRNFRSQKKKIKKNKIHLKKYIHCLMLPPSIYFEISIPLDAYNYET